ncbi:hypothetical protein FHS04_002793 [Mesoflavibacter sabulilitoris]|uniref:Uncharacterized protein n=1 Tax=Mesoflavibacter zeaxanthinifaciens subsp. sabulilitoris TaxID=1520893 RepID=A0A2T1NNN4_9FLAO|nr:hypothetical protein [Mesoflavibacter zeaxanthinifaciens]MBB3125249.1 hypothetical protein [Mesoflavibacter zeaxanthinifaciens subsp. sabulilitoris]PSG94484.1 hypothetical protein C7H61_00695 [Mesoflavibacter zeaxanthinifaciens subsp. sabulilitoris]
MNISEFNFILRNEALLCYQRACFIIENSPVELNIEKCISDVIEFEINQSLGSKALKSVMSNNLSNIQIKQLNNHINNYKERIAIKLNNQYLK